MLYEQLNLFSVCFIKIEHIHSHRLKGMIPLLFYCVKHIHRQFKTYLKLWNIHFKQIEKLSRLLGKTLPWYSFKTILYCMLWISQFVWYYLFWYVMFSLCCMVSWCCIVFLKPVKWKVYKTLFWGIWAIVLHPFYQFSQPFPEQINAKQKLLF